MSSRATIPLMGSITEVPPFRAVAVTGFLLAGVTVEIAAVVHITRVASSSSPNAYELTFSPASSWTVNDLSRSYWAICA